MTLMSSAISVSAACSPFCTSERGTSMMRLRARPTAKPPAGHRAKAPRHGRQGGRRVCGRGRKGCRRAVYSHSTVARVSCPERTSMISAICELVRWSVAMWLSFSWEAQMAAMSLVCDCMAPSAKTMIIDALPRNTPHLTRSGNLLDAPRDLRYHHHFRAAGESRVQGDVATIAAHDSDEAGALMGVAGHRARG